MKRQIEEIEFITDKLNNTHEICLYYEERPSRFDGIGIWVRKHRGKGLGYSNTYVTVDNLYGFNYAISPRLYSKIILLLGDGLDDRIKRGLDHLLEMYNKYADKTPSEPF